MDGHREPVTWSPTTRRVSGLVRPVPLDPSGEAGPTRGQAQGPGWIRSSHGWYVPAGTPRHLVEQWILERSVRLPGHAAVTGWAACRLHGAAYFDGVAEDGPDWLPVPLAVGPHLSLSAGPSILVTNHVLLPHDRTTAYGIPAVVPQRAVYDAARLSPGLRQAVRAIDMAAAARLCSLAMLREYAEKQPQDARRVLRAVALASEHALSPAEVDVRLVYELDLRLPRPEVNCAIHDTQGRIVARADLLDVEAGLVIEVDGAHHRRPRRASADLATTDVLHRLGLEVVRLTGLDARKIPLVAGRIRLARSRSRFEPPDQRAWWFSRRPDELDARLRHPPGSTGTEGSPS